MKSIRIAFIALAVIIMVLPCALLPVIQSGIGAENRLPAPWPQLSNENGINSDFHSQYEDWLSDHVALRKQCIGLYSKAMQALGTSAERQVILGRDGWLFFRETLNDYTGIGMLTDDEIARAVLVLDIIDRKLRSQGSRLLLAIVPNKASIYPEMMNPLYPRSEEAGNAERLMTAAHVRSVRLYEVLNEHSDEGLYFHGDTHWNGMGARYGAHAILSVLSEETETDIQLPDPDVPAETRRDWPGDLMRMLDPYTDECEPQQYYSSEHDFEYQGRYRTPEDLTIRTTGGKADLVLLVLRDSFSNQLVEYFSGAVKDVTYMRAMPLPLSAAGETDAVILEMVERRLPELLEAPPDMVAPKTAVPEDLDDARIAELTYASEVINGKTRIYGSFSQWPSGLDALCLGIRSSTGEQWFEAFPVSGKGKRSDGEFSVLLDDLPETSDICVYMHGDSSIRSAWMASDANSSE